MFTLSMKVIKTSQASSTCLIARWKYWGLFCFGDFFVSVFKTKINRALSDHRIQTPNYRAWVQWSEVLRSSRGQGRVFSHHLSQETGDSPLSLWHTHALASLTALVGWSLMWVQGGSQKVKKPFRRTRWAAWVIIQHSDSVTSMFLQSLAPSCSCLDKEERAATTGISRAFQAREERERWPPSSGVRRWAWCSSSCRWRLPTAAWLSSGSWGWCSSETWVVPGWHAELLEMCPRVPVLPSKRLGKMHL